MCRKPDMERLNNLIAKLDSDLIQDQVYASIFLAEYGKDVEKAIPILRSRVNDLCLNSSRLSTQEESLGRSIAVTLRSYLASEQTIHQTTTRTAAEKCLLELANCGNSLVVAAAVTQLGRLCKNGGFAVPVLLEICEREDSTSASAPTLRGRAFQALYRIAPQRVVSALDSQACQEFVDALIYWFRKYMTRKAYREAVIVTEELKDFASFCKQAARYEQN